MNYFLLIDGKFFADRLRPALTNSWRSRSFTPCRDLCKELLPRVETFHGRYHIGEGETLLERAAGDLVFEGEFWYALVGELLFYSADEIPEFQTSLDSLSLLVVPEQRPMIEQAHRGSLPLTFGAAVYRPEHCGMNDRSDIGRLARFLASINPLDWKAESLRELDEEEREEELAFARDCLAVLADTFQRADAARQVIVHENL